PDFRGDAEEEEQTAPLESMIESVEDLTESIRPPTIRFGGGEYLCGWFHAPPSETAEGRYDIVERIQEWIAEAECIRRGA
ncbi:MAG: hypothetical protein ACREIC_09285, partial [Limisphaerales bacterium]